MVFKETGLNKSLRKTVIEQKCTEFWTNDFKRGVNNMYIILKVNEVSRQMHETWRDRATNSTYRIIYLRSKYEARCVFVL